VSPLVKPPPGGFVFSDPVSHRRAGIGQRQDARSLVSGPADVFDPGVDEAHDPKLWVGCAIARWRTVIHPPLSTAAASERAAAGPN